MRNLFKVLGVLLLFILNAESKASHLLGGHITYYAIDSVNYKVYVTVYRDCSGVNTNNVDLKVEFSGGDTSFAGTLKSTSHILQRPSSCNLPTSCSGGSLYAGFEEKVFEYSVNLNGILDCNIRFSWAECCRITSLNLGASNNNFYLYTDLNKCVSFQNRSLVFDEGLPFIVKNNDDKVMSFAGIDTTSFFDSITYELTPALQSKNVQTQFSTQHSFDKPLTYLGFPNNSLPWPASFKLGQLTGNLTFRPNSSNQITTLSIKISCWKLINGSMQNISTMHRNHTIYVNSVTSVLGGSVNFSTILNGNNGTFEDINYICAKDTSVLDLRVRPLNSAIVPHRFLPFSPLLDDTAYIVSSNNEKLRFRFYPDTSDVKDKVQLFHVRIEDQQCSVVTQGWQYLAIPFVVVPEISMIRRPEVSISLGCNSVILKAKDTLDLKLLPIQWTYNGQTKSGDSVQYIVQDTGWQYYSYVLDNRGSCKMTIADSFRLANISYDHPSISSNITEDCIQDYGWLTADSAQDVKSWYLGFDYDDTLDFPTTYFLPKKNSYFSVIIDSQNCYFIDTLRFQTLNTPKLIGKSIQYHCNGNLNSLQFNSQIDSTYGIGPFQYFVDGNQASLDTIFYPNQNQLIARKLTDKYGCEFYDTVSIVKNNAFTVYAGEDTVTCRGNTFQLNGKYGSTANPVTSIKWNGVNSPLITSYQNNKPEFVKLTIERNDGCAIADSFFVSDYTGYSATIIGDTSLCYPSQKQFVATSNGGTGAIAITWYHLGDSSQIDSLYLNSLPQNSQSQLVLKLVDSASCVAFDTLNLYYRDPHFSLNTSNRPLCLGDSFTFRPSVFNGFIPHTYNWNIGQAALDSFVYRSQVSGLNSDTVRLSISDNYGCLSDTFTSITLSVFNAQINAFPLVCGGDSIRVKAQYSGAMLPLVYQWDIGNQSFSDSDYFFVPNPGQNYKIHLSLSDANSCSQVDSFDFTTTNFQVHLTGDTLLCLGEEVDLLATPRLGPGPFNFQWFGGANANDSILHIRNSDYSAGVHKVVVRATDANNCSSIDSLQIVVNQFGAVPISDKLLCFGDSLRIQSNDTGAIGNIQYSWILNAQTQQTPVMSSASLSEGVYSIYFNAIDDSQCGISDTIGLDIRKLKSKLIGDLTVCGGDTISLNYLASDYFGSLKNSWYVNGVFHSDSLIAEFIDTNLISKMVELVLVDDNQCELTLNDSLHFYRLTQINFNSSGFCDNYGMIDLHSLAQPSGGYFTWNQMYIDSISASRLGKGNHLFKYVAGDIGCEDSSDLIVYIHPEPQLNFYSLDTVIFQNKQSTFYSNIIANNPLILWEFGDGTTLSDSIIARHTYSDTGYFTVSLKVQDSFCFTTLEKSNYIYVLDSHILNVLVPELFEISLYPNPILDSKLIVSIGQEVDFISIRDIQGKELLKAGPLETGEHELDLGSFVPGSYLVFVKSGGSSKTYKIVKHSNRIK